LGFGCEVARERGCAVGGGGDAVAVKGEELAWVGVRWRLARRRGEEEDHPGPIGGGNGSDRAGTGEDELARACVSDGRAAERGKNLDLHLLERFGG